MEAIKQPRAKGAIHTGHLHGRHAHSLGAKPFCALTNFGWSTSPWPMLREPAQFEKERAIQIFGWSPHVWRSVSGGYTAAALYVVSRGRDRAFVKVATTPLTARLLRRECFAYERVRGRFVPQLVGWSDDELAPMLIIEDRAAQAEAGDA